MTMLRTTYQMLGLNWIARNENAIMTVAHFLGVPWMDLAVDWYMRDNPYR